MKCYNQGVWRGTSLLISLKGLFLVTEKKPGKREWKVTHYALATASLWIIFPFPQRE